LAASQYDGRVAILDKTNGITLLTPTVDYDYTNFMALAPDGLTIVVFTQAYDGTNNRIWFVTLVA